MNPQDDRRILVDQVEALLYETDLARQRGNYEQGADLANTAIMLADELGERGAEAHGYRLMAMLLTRAGDLERAVTCCDKAEFLLRGLGQDASAELCEVLLAKAYALNELGLCDEGLDAVIGARDIARALADPQLLCWVEIRFGCIYDSLGESQQARDFMVKGLAMAETLSVDTQFTSLNNLVDNAMSYVPKLRAADDHAEAESVLAQGLMFAERALALAGELEHYRTSLALTNFGVLLSLDGQAERALEMLHTAREIALEHGYPSLELSVLRHLPDILLSQGRVADAIAGLYDVTQRAAELDETPVQMEALRVLSEAHELADEFELALRRHREFYALEQTVRSGRAATRARVLAHHLELQKARLDAEEARRMSAVYQARSDQLEADKAALQQRSKELERSALTDSLTGIGNRRYLDTRLGPLFDQARSEGRLLCVTLLDIDHFKAVNDSFGHAVGDDVLVRVAELIVRHSRSGDLVARYGGEEFLLAFIDTDAVAAVRLCERLRASVEEEDWTAIHPDLRITISAGVCSNVNASSAREMVHLADQQLYEAKQSGRNRVRQLVA